MRLIFTLLLLFTVGCSGVTTGPDLNLQAYPQHPEADLRFINDDGVVGFFGPDTVLSAGEPYRVLSERDDFMIGNRDDISKVWFYKVVNGVSTKCEPTERKAPYDYCGNESYGGPDVFSEGIHTIRAVITFSNGDRYEKSWTFEAVGSDPEPIWEAPIVISSGGTYSGNWRSTDPGVAAVTVRTSQPVVIENSRIESAGRLIHATPGHTNDITIRNVSGKGLPGKRFAEIDGYSRVVIEDSYLEDTLGIWLHDSEPGATVKVLRNESLNIRGQDVGYFVQFLQLDKGRGLIGSEIAYNKVLNEPFESVTEDVINFYRTSGTSGSPVEVYGNCIRGAYPEDPTSDGHSGGGIMLGDGGGAYLRAYGNTVVSTTNYGVAIAGGENNTISENVAVSSGKLADGRTIAAQNVGMYVWNNSSPAAFGGNEIYDNVSGWANYSAANDWQNNDNSYWLPGASSEYNNRRYHPDGPPTLADEDGEWQACVSNLP